MLLDRNQLPAPDAITRPAFDTVVANFKQDFLAAVAKDDPQLAQQLKQSLQQPGEMITKLFETFSQYLLNEIERRNQQARQLLPGFAQGSNLDQLVAHQGISRQVFRAGDDQAFPKVLAVKETDEALLLRYLLQPHAPAAGSRMQYKASLLTLDEKPVITLDKPQPDQVRLTYQLNPKGMAAKIKDANGLRSAAGKVTATVLAQVGPGEAESESRDGTANEVLLEAVRDYFQRDDVAPGTDQITVQSAAILHYQQKVQVTIGQGPDLAITEQSIKKQLQQYADRQHALGAEVRPDYISHLLYQQGAKRATVLKPDAAISCSDQQAPWCSSIDVEVLRL